MLEKTRIYPRKFDVNRYVSQSDVFVGTDHVGFEAPITNTDWTSYFHRSGSSIPLALVNGNLQQAEDHLGNLKYCRFGNGGVAVRYLADTTGTIFDCSSNYYIGFNMYRANWATNFPTTVIAAYRTTGAGGINLYGISGQTAMNLDVPGSTNLMGINLNWLDSGWHNFALEFIGTSTIRLWIDGTAVLHIPLKTTYTPNGLFQIGGGSYTEDIRISGVQWVKGSYIGSDTVKRIWARTCKYKDLVYVTSNDHYGKIISPNWPTDGKRIPIDMGLTNGVGTSLTNNGYNTYYYEVIKGVCHLSFDGYNWNMSGTDATYRVKVPFVVPFSAGTDGVYNQYSNVCIAYDAAYLPGVVVIYSNNGYASITKAAGGNFGTGLNVGGAKVNIHYPIE